MHNRVIWLECAVLAVVPIILWLLSDLLIDWCGILAYLILWGMWGGYGVLVLLRSRKPKPRLVFPRANIQEIEAVLPHESLKLFQQWLVPGVLDSLYERHILTEVANPTEMVKLITHELKQSVSKISKEALYKSLKDPNCAHAYVALIVLTITLRCIAAQEEAVVGNKKVSPYRNLMIHIQWNQAKEVLFREMYRLSELGILLQGNLTALFLNVDLQEPLWQILEIIEMPEQGKAQQQVAQQNGAVDKKVAAKSVASAELFFKWVQREMRQHPLNQGSYFFKTPEMFIQQQNQIYVSESALVGFALHTKMAVGEIKKTLLSEGVLATEAYQLKQANSPVVRLYLVTIHFNVHCIEPVSGIITAIEEGSV